MKKTIVSLFFILVCALGLSAQDAIIGGLVWPTSQSGLYSINLESNTLTRRELDPEMFALQPGGAYGQSGFRKDNLYYYTNYFTEGTTVKIYHAVYDLNTNRRIWMRTDGLIASAPSDMTYCETDGKAYGCFHCPEGLGEAYVFGTIDLQTFEVSRIKVIYQNWLAMAAAPDGTLYAINEGGLLLKVDKQTGNTQVVAQTSAPVYFESSACISADGTKMYLSVTDTSEESYIMTIDLATGETLGMNNFGNDREILGLSLDQPLPAEGAPAIATNFEVPVCNSSTATATFQMPTTTAQGGQLGDAPFTAIITVDGTEKYNASHEKGQTVTSQIDALTTGYHTFTLSTINDAGQSRATSVRRWTGYDKPCTPQNVIFSREGETNTIVWDAVTSGIHEGYIDPSAITYNIYRYPGGQLAASGLSTPTYSEQMDEPTTLTTIYYTVEAVSNDSGESSLKGESNHLSFSAIQPPYSQTFDTDQALEAYTIIDANNDENTWHWYTNGTMRIFGSDEEGLDDWLITPAVHLEAGKYYEFSLTLHGFKRAYAEYFEIKCGKDNTAEGMTIPLLGNTLLSADAPTPYAVGMVAPETGTYYFGIHATSPAGTQYIYADDINISEALEPFMPAPVSNLTLTRAPMGEIAVDVTFTLPTTTMGGQELSEITRVTVVRDGYLALKEYTDAVPGQQISFTDKPGFTTFRRYTVTVYNSYGSSTPAEAVEYVGPYAPEQPTNFTVSRTDTDGQVHLSWTPPTHDVQGNELSPNCLTYTVAGVVDGSLAYIVDKSTETEFTWQAQAAGQPQAFVSYALYANTDGGSSYKLESRPCPVGAPYTLPFVESFVSGSTQNAWYPEDITGYTMWDTGTNTSISGITSSDADNGYIYGQSLAANNISTINSGLITLSGSNVILDFKYWSSGQMDNSTTTVCLLVDGETQQLTTISHAAEESGWQTAIVSLEEYVGKDVQIQLQAKFDISCIVAYDNIRVMKNIDNNLSISETVIPEEIQAGKQFNIQAVIQNNGMEDIMGLRYYVVVNRDGQELTRRRGFGTLRTGKSVSMTFSDVLGVMDEGDHIYEILIDYADDEYAADNTSGEIKVRCYVPDFPVPSDVYALEQDGTVSIKWEKPIEPDAMQHITEDFESYSAGTQTDFGGWTLHDGDEIVSGTIGALPIPWITSDSFLSYTIVNNTLEGLSAITAHSGNQVLLSIFAREGQNDDWLISPALSGHEQTIKFWARSGTAIYPESFIVMASTEISTNTDDFEEIMIVESVPKAWTEYQCVLPEGTMRFAIRCVSDDAYYFTLDDIEYDSDLYSTKDLIGYKVYDGTTLVSSLGVDEMSQQIDKLPQETNDCSVTAVYAKGESRPVKVSRLIDAIESVKAEQSEGAVYDLTGRKVNRMTRGVVIIDGNKIVK